MDTSIILEDNGQLKVTETTVDGDRKITTEYMVDKQEKNDELNTAKAIIKEQIASLEAILVTIDDTLNHINGL